MEWKQNALHSCPKGALGYPKWLALCSSYSAALCTALKTLGYWRIFGICCQMWCWDSGADILRFPGASKINSDFKNAFKCVQFPFVKGFSNLEMETKDIFISTAPVFIRVQSVVSRASFGEKRFFVRFCLISPVSNKWINCQIITGSQPHTNWFTQRLATLKMFKNAFEVDVNVLKIIWLSFRIGAFQSKRQTSLYCGIWAFMGTVCPKKGSNPKRSLSIALDRHKMLE